MNSASTNEGLEHAGAAQGGCASPERPRRPKIWEASFPRVLTFVIVIFSLAGAALGLPWLIFRLPAAWLAFPFVGMAALVLLIPDLGFYLWISIFWQIGRWTFGLFFDDETE